MDLREEPARRGRHETTSAIDVFPDEGSRPADDGALVVSFVQPGKEQRSLLLRKIVRIHVAGLV